MGGAPLLHRLRVRRTLVSSIHCPHLTGVQRACLCTSSLHLSVTPELSREHSMQRQCTLNGIDNAVLYLLHIVRHLDKVCISMFILLY